MALSWFTKKLIVTIDVPFGFILTENESIQSVCEDSALFADSRLPDPAGKPR